MLRHIAAAAMAACAAMPIGAQVSVSSMGQPTFAQPVSVVPGVGGMSPQLSIVYSGTGVNGPLGHAWSLQGISTIGRCSAEKLIDGTSAAVGYVASDKLCLDGQRLVPTDAGGTPTAPGNDADGLSSGFREYRTSKDIFTRIRAYGIAGTQAANGPLYFKAWTKSGQVFEYGQPPSTGATPKALVLAQGKTAVMAWAVARVSDVSGNYMDFTYNQRTVAFGSGPVQGSPTVGVEWNIASILYTGKTGAAARAPYNEVRFDYVDRGDVAGRPTDRAEAYHAGSKNVSVARLRRIRSFIGTPLAQPVLVRTTQLDYEAATVTGRSRLKGLRECYGESGNDAGEPSGKCSQWARFTYADTGQPDIELSNTFNLSNERLMSADGKYGVLVADFNSDGRADIIRWSANATYENRLYYSKGDGSFTQENDLVLNNTLFSADGCRFSMVADMDANGLPDIVTFVGGKRLDGTPCDDIGDSSITVSRNRGGGTFQSKVLEAKDLAGNTKWLTLDRATSTDKGANGWTYGATFYLMDVNGDGRPDVVSSTLPAQSTRPDDACPGTCTRIYLADETMLMVEKATNVGSVTLYSDPGKPGDPQFHKRLSDADADGLVDLVAVGKQNSQGSWRSLGNGNFAAFTGSATCEKPLDFNGDGRADCLETVAGDPAKSALYTSVGSSSVKTASFNLNTTGHPLQPPAGLPVGQNYGYFMVDWNSDGRTDLFRWHDTPSLNRLYLSDGDGSFTLDTPAGHAITQFKRSDAKYDIVEGDFRGNGSVDLLRLSDFAPGAGDDKSATNNLYTRASPYAPDRLLSVTSPTGIVTSIGYGNLVSSTSGRYLSDRGTGYQADYPLIDIAPAFSVVTTLTVDSGVGSHRVASHYGYFGLKTSVDGSGTFGFRAMRVQSLSPNGEDSLTTATTYHLQRPYAGLARNTETRVAPLGEYDRTLTLSKTSNIYCDKTSATSPDDATEAEPCAAQAKVVRPYLRKSIETGFDLVRAALPSVVTENTFNTTGDAAIVEVTTTTNIDGTNQSYVKKTTNNFDPPKTDGDWWILGRLTSATVNSEVPNLNLFPSAGTSPNAKRTSGIGLP